MKTNQITHEHGSIHYHYFKDKNLLLFMGSYVNTDQRGKGIFKNMVNELFSKFETGTKVQVPLSNKKLVPFFESLGFQKVDKIEYWGSPENAVCMEGKI